MKTLAKFQFVLFAVSISISFSVYSQPGESIILNPSTGDYTVTYWNGESLENIVFVPSTKITPAIHSKFSLVSVEKIIYRYTVSSKRQSKQILNSIRFDPVYQLIAGQSITTDFDALTAEQESTALATPNGWGGRIASSLSGNGARVSWHPVSGLTGIKPGGTMRGFGFSSYALPGLGVVQFEGDHPVLAFPDEGFGPDSAIADEFYRLPDFVPRNAAVPMIAVPDPFDAAALLESIQTQTHTWIAMQLLDATFSSQLDRSFQSAISAYHLNQPRVGKQEIQTIRELLKKEQPDLGRDEEHESEKNHEKHDDRKTALIDKLAVRVLDFDLEYVTQRMDDDAHDGNKDKEHDSAR